MASAYFGFLFGTMAKVIPLAGGVLSDFANLLAIVLSRALFAGGL
jgi:hypothetical protein